MDKVQEYLESGKRYEDASGRWTIWTVGDLIDDSLERLPRYRRAIEAARKLQQNRATFRSVGDSGFSTGYLAALDDLGLAMECALLGEENVDGK